MVQPAEFQRAEGAFRPVWCPFTRLISSSQSLGQPAWEEIIVPHSFSINRFHSTESPVASCEQDIDRPSWSVHKLPHLIGPQSRSANYTYEEIVACALVDCNEEKTHKLANSANNTPDTSNAC